jgi:putative MATE family efflux protein
MMMRVFILLCLLAWSPIEGFTLARVSRAAPLYPGGLGGLTTLRNAPPATEGTSVTSPVPVGEEVFDKVAMKRGLDKEFATVALPAFVSLAADPIASLVDAIYVARLGPVEQAAMGIAISAQFSIAKLYNDPLLKTSTSLVAGKEGEELEGSVATAVVTAMVIGIIQCVIFLYMGNTIMRGIGLKKDSEMLKPAVEYLKWRGFGVPAATMLLVTNGIFRGRGDTTTPLYCTTFGNLVNIILDPILIFHCGMGCAGAGAATAISQWASAIPLIYLLNKAVPIRIWGRSKAFFKEALSSYLAAGGLIFLRTVAKIAAYTVTSSAAARLGTVPMAAYSMTFNLGFATSQLCESVAIAGQALLAREYPFGSAKRKSAARHVIRRCLVLGLLISAALSTLTLANQSSVLRKLTSSEEVYQAAAQIMPVVLLTQLFKGLAYSTGGIILGGLDWFWSSLGMQIAAALAIGMVYVMPLSLWNIWASLCVFMATQVVVSGYRIVSNKGPWNGLDIFGKDSDEVKVASGSEKGVNSGSDVAMA